MMLKVLAMFLGICLALVHIVVGVMSIVIYGEYIQGAFFVMAAVGFALAGFFTIFNNLKAGLVFYVMLFFLCFCIMLGYQLLMEFFSCLLTVAAAFMVILEIRTEYFAMEQEALEQAGKKEEKAMILGSKPDPLGFDQNFYYNKYYDIKTGKKKKKGGGKKKRAAGGRENPPDEKRPSGQEESA